MYMREEQPVKLLEEKKVKDKITRAYLSNKSSAKLARYKEIIYNVTATPRRAHVRGG